MITRNSKLPICSECKEWPWCPNIPQECERRKQVYKEVYCWFGDQYIIVPVTCIDEDTEEDIINTAEEILFSNMSWEVVNGEDN